MASCASCGHLLGVGRFCTSCGAPVDSAPGDDWRTDTAERGVPRVTDPRLPPAAVAPPPPPRYPLFADEVDAHPPDGPISTTGSEQPEPQPPAPARVQAGAPAGARAGADAAEPAEPQPDRGYAYAADADGYEYPYEEERRSPVLWILAAALALVLIAVGWWFLVRSDGAEGADDGSEGERDPQSSASSTGDGVDVAGRASARAPETAPPNEDVTGEQVSYDASNMLDGVPETAWRAPGDASGMSLTFTLRQPTELSRVGLVNGYAKTSTSPDATFDWYLGNRRVNAVVWSFGDGTKIRQQLVEDRGLQTVQVPDVVTDEVVLRIVRVTRPGEGPAGRDYTAISEVSLVGVPVGD